MVIDTPWGTCCLWSPGEKRHRKRLGNRWVFRRSPGSSRSGIDVGIAKEEVDVGRVNLGVDLDDGRSLVQSAGGLFARGVVVNIDDSLGKRFVIDAGARVDVQSHTRDHIGPAAVIDIGARGGQVESKNRVGIDVPVEDRGGPGGLK